MKNKTLDVFYEGRIVGTLAETSDKRIAFEYSDEWLENGFSISPFSLPLK
ncbi:MAG: HipA N-terminal domain-containing protein, partial [Eubacterium sp.]|nr:HipA N-terminal domain-containing protein [Eubacterium sp.]